jgi:hypothetical protein
VLWCLQDGRNDSYQVARIFDPGGGFRFMLASTIKRTTGAKAGMSGELWWPHLKNDPGY